MKRSKSRVLLLLIAAAVLSFSVVAQGAGLFSKSVYLTAGKADTIDLQSPVADILVANPAIADVGALRANRLYVVGKTTGDTNVLAFDADGNQLADIAVHVHVDARTLQDTINEYFPGESVRVRTVKNDIVLSGSVSNPSVANQVRDVAGRFVTLRGQSVVDLMSVRGEQQVMLKVRVIEARRSVLREYGINTDYKANKTSLSGAAVDTVGGSGLTELVPFGVASIFFDDDNDFGPLGVGLQAMARNGLINVLAEPNLTAISGETAGFLAGGEFPVPTGRDQDGNITLEFKKFGVSLNFTPTVLTRDRIALQLSTEVSARDDNSGVKLINTTIPGLSVRKAETTIEMGSGGTIMIAGLIKSDTLNSLTGLPGVEDLPVLGDLVKSKSFARNESELIILVTPYLVKPYAEPDAEVLREPPVPAMMGAKVPPSLPPVLEDLSLDADDGSKPQSLSRSERRLEEARRRPVAERPAEEESGDDDDDAVVEKVQPSRKAGAKAAVKKPVGYMLD